MNDDDALARVARAANLRQHAEREYRRAVELARDAGHSDAAIGRAAGVTRQAIRQMKTVGRGGHP